MRRKVIATLVLTALLSSPLTAGAAANDARRAEEIRARAAEARAKGREVVVHLRAGARILVGKKELPFESARAYGLSGKIREVREKDFVLAEPDGRSGEIASVISFDDVTGVEHPSRFKKVLGGIGRVSLGVAVAPVILPLIGVLALIGQLPEC